MIFCKRRSASSMRMENRLQMAFSFSLRLAVRHSMYVSSP
jgi:hypothetical protein